MTMLLNPQEIRTAQAELLKDFVEQKVLSDKEVQGQWTKKAMFKPKTTMGKS